MAPNRPQYGSIDEFRAAKGARVTALQKFVESGASSQPGVLDEVVMSTATVDRAGDTVNPQGWALEQFRTNPVLMWCHDYSRPPVGKVSTVLVDGGALIGRRLVFMEREVDPFAASIGAMYTHPERFLRMFSVGFMPGRWQFNETRGGVDFLEQNLLELSACPIGMNPDALAGAKSAGIDMAPWLPLAAKSLDGDKDAPVWLDQKNAWMIHRTLTAPIHQVPEWKTYMDEQVAAIRAEMKAALVPPPPPAPRPPDIAKALEVAGAYLSNRTANLVSRIPEE